MRKLFYTGRFKKDLKNIKKQMGYNEHELEQVIVKLREDLPLEEKYQDHPLHGKYEGSRECHITPDWLLVYGKDDYGLKLILMRTGIHSKLFGS